MTGRHAVVVGGGIVGLAVAHELLGRGWRITVLEKEHRWAAHQTGHNSNVVHSGLYYRPGSLKADLCNRGRASMVRFAREHGVAVEVCGKLVVATRPDEVPWLRALYERGLANGVRVELLDAEQAREYEPEGAAIAAIRVAETAITDYPAVCAALVRLLTDGGADLRTGSAVTGIVPTNTGVIVETGTGTVSADLLVNCAGLHSDRLARLAGLRLTVQIVPFRGEYYELRPHRRHLVRGLIYPVPDPEQAVTDLGTLVDDFLLETAPNQIHVLNAPSPAATSSLEIAKAVAAQAPQLEPGYR